MKTKLKCPSHDSWTHISSSDFPVMSTLTKSPQYWKSQAEHIGKTKKSKAYKLR